MLRWPRLRNVKTKETVATPSRGRLLGSCLTLKISFSRTHAEGTQSEYVPIYWIPKWVSSIWLMQSDIAKVQSDMYICFNANQPGINAMWPSVYMHSGNLELCNATSVINAFQHHVKCHFDITTEYLLEYWAIYNKKLTWNPNEYLQLLHSFP